jgi:predicted AAA+ superfamily ATPase
LQAAVSGEQPPSKTVISELEQAFSSYLIHGGYLTAINDIARDGEIMPSTYATYSDWIRGDVLKRNKQEHYLKEILTAIIRSYGSQVTWNSLARSLSIDHSMTVADYVALLARMDAVFIQSALREDRLSAAPKKAKKVMFVDPFIYRATCKWLNLDIKEDAELTGKLVEACAATHYHRFYPTYYIKGKGEIDIAYVEGNRFFPVEIKWTGQVRPGTLKMLSNYKNSKLLCRQNVEDGMVHGIAAEHLPLALLKMGPSPVVKQD